MPAFGRVAEPGDKAEHPHGIQTRWNPIWLLELRECSDVETREYRAGRAKEASTGLADATNRRYERPRFLSASKRNKMKAAKGRETIGLARRRPEQTALLAAAIGHLYRRRVSRIAFTSESAVRRATKCSAA